MQPVEDQAVVLEQAEFLVPEQPDKEIQEEPRDLIPHLGMDLVVVVQAALELGEGPPKESADLEMYLL
jgi:hypothetical protein